MAVVIDGTTGVSKIQDGVAVSNIGYTPFNAASAGALATRNVLRSVGAGPLTGTYSAGTWHNLYNHSATIGGTGVFFLSVYVDTYYTGDSYQELYSGWYSVGNISTNSSAANDLYITRGGHAPNTSSVSFRLLRQPGGSGGSILIQFNSNQTWTGLNNTGGRDVYWNTVQVS